MAKNPRLIDLKGQRFGRWLVREQAGNAPKGAALWKCTCDCGTDRVVVGSDLRNGKSTSCGCVMTAVISQLRRTHGETGTRIHRIWQNMKARCGNPKNPGFVNYGARGIRVCDEWRDSYEAFKAWALGAGYKDHLSIERIDVDGDYCPENCTWADAAIQSANRRYTQKAPDGELWLHKARRNGISTSMFRCRMSAGWPVEVAISWPKNIKRVERERDEHGRYR